MLAESWVHSSQEPGKIHVEVQWVEVVVEAIWVVEGEADEEVEEVDVGRVVQCVEWVMVVCHFPENHHHHQRLEYFF